ncbi:MAG: ribonuclease H-like domain-containing protein [Myxococcaceae bacterium]
MRSLADKIRGLAQPPPEVEERARDRDLVAPTFTRHGPVQLLERTHGPGWLQGRVAIAPAREAKAEILSRLSLDETLQQVDPTRMLFVDTETTGLHGGAGTLPFLVGLAWFDQQSLQVCQLFLGQPGEERPLLSMLAERLEAATMLVTFNGKCFDWPLLKTRFVLNRLAVPRPKPHLDLLHCARRVFKRRLGATRLTDLESAVLGFRRKGDIDGAQIPAAYFAWLRYGVRSDLEVVLEHNVKDVVSMAAVLAELCRRYELPSGDDAAADCLSLAQVARRAKDLSRAAELAFLAAERATDPAVAFEANLLASRCAERAGDFPRAVDFALRSAAEAKMPWELRAAAHLVLARLFEHKLKLPSEALAHARLAVAAEDREVSRRRIARLEAKAPVSANAR